MIEPPIKHLPVIAEHKLGMKMQCKYIEYSDGSGGFYDNMVDEIWQEFEVVKWEYVND